MIIKDGKRVPKIYSGENVVLRAYKGTDQVYQYLPVGYKECKYIQSTDGAYINTLFTPADYNGNYTFEAVAQFPELPTRTQYISGAGVSGARSCNIEVTSAYRVTCYIGSTATVAGRTTLTATQILEKNTYRAVIKDNAKCEFYINGVDYSTSNTGDTMATVSLTLFNSRSVLTQRGSFKLYSCKIWDENGKLVRYFVPCLDANDTPGLYDVITKDTFYNHASGTTGFLYELA